MRFVEIINKKKFTLISIFMFLYIVLNLIDGERGLISYFKKQHYIEQLISDKEILTKKLISVEKKNNLLTDNIDIDYLETLYRKKFMVGKRSEKIILK